LFGGQDGYYQGAIVHRQRREWVIGIDYIQEGFINLVRNAIGKNKRKGDEIKVEHAVITKISKVKKGSTKKHTERLSKDAYMKIQFKKMDIFDAKVFAMVTRTLNKSNIFDRPVNEPDTGNLYSPRDGKEMNARILCIRSIGGKKMDKYATRFYIETQNQATCSENDMGIPAIVLTLKTIKESLEKW
jgi:hypothetical protein